MDQQKLLSAMTELFVFNVKTVLQDNNVKYT